MFRDLVVAIFAALAVCTTVVFVPSAAQAAEITADFPMTMKPALEQLLPRFEQSSGNLVKAQYASIGVLTDGLQKGAVADVAILSSQQVRDLESSGRISAGTSSAFARAGIGLFARKDSPKLDVGTTDAFKRTLLAARSIAISDPKYGGASGPVVLGVIQALGIADQMTPKTTLTGLDNALFDAVISGSADIGFSNISDIVARPAVAFMGPLPADVQRYTSYSIAVVADGLNRAGASALITFLQSPAASAVMRANGFEP